MYDIEKAKKIGERIEEVRKDRKLTQEQLGELCRFTKSKLSKIENGIQLPEIDEMLDIANVLKVRLEYLLGIDNIPDVKTEQIIAGIRLFSDITTTKEYITKYESTYSPSNFIFQIDKDYLMLTGNARLFALIKSIARIESSKAKLSNSDYNRKVIAAKNNFENKPSKEEESYFLISSKQMEQIIQQAVEQQRAVDKCLLESQRSLSLVEKPLKINKLPKEAAK